MEKILKLGVPKGSLESATIELFRKSGWRISLVPEVISLRWMMKSLPPIDPRSRDVVACRKRGN